MGYISSSTANPNGWRSFNAQLSQPSVPRNDFRLSGLEAYYPANYYVPTPLNITMRPQPNIYANGCAAADGLGDFINNIQWLRPGGWRSRDNDYSPIPRIYLPPEVANMSGLGNDPGFDVLSVLRRRRPQFSGGASAPNPADPHGFFFPRTPINPSQFPTHGHRAIWTPDPADPSGIYFPRTPQPVVPAWLRARATDWTGANVNSLSFLGAVTPSGARMLSASRTLAINPTARPVAPTAPLRIVTPRSLISVGTGGRLHPTPPVIIVGGPVSPIGAPIPTPQPIVTPGTPPTYPPGVIAHSGGICTVESTPETGSVMSTVPCATLPGYSAGTPPTVTYPPTTPATPPARTRVLHFTPTAARPAPVASATGLTLAQQQAIAAANQAAQQYAAQQAAAGGGGTAAAPAADGSTSSAADVLGWLSQSSLITGVPNWVIAGGGGLLVLWIMNKGKK